MYGQKRVLGGIRGLSPAREKWASKPAGDLPKKVTVQLTSGESGRLDMTDPRAVLWARIIEELAEEHRPVYLEIDEEMGVITNLLIPALYRVERVDEDEHGDLMIRLQPSHAVHFVLRSDPNSSAMQSSLWAALADGSDRLITETRDEHEIIDVRLPERVTRGTGSSPTTPAEDPPVSEARSKQVFGNMGAESCDPCGPSSDCIPFLYPDDGCWIRAHMMCRLMQKGGPDTATNPPEDPEKVWIHFDHLHAVPTANHPDCSVSWAWHVAPALMVTVPGGNQKRVIDPSLCDTPVSLSEWMKQQDADPSAHLHEGPWTDWNHYGDGEGPLWSFDQASDYYFMKDCRRKLGDRCRSLGPPPYGCTRGCFFIVDRSTFSDDEIEAMLQASTPALIQSALYVVVDGFSPNELGFSAPTMQYVPTLNIAPLVAGMSVTPVQLNFEYPFHLNRRQRLTWVYDVSFAGADGFMGAPIVVALQASMASPTASVSNVGYLYLIKQPNPYEIDGAISWLSTDLRVFQIMAGQSKFGIPLTSNPSGFIAQVIANLNNGNTGGQTFDGDISVDQQSSRLELSSTVGGTPVYNFAVAKVRYRSLTLSATDVRVFFRLFPAATTSLEYDQATTYRRHATGSTVVPLLGIRNNELAAIPCFASPRIDSGVTSMTVQTDAPNVQTIPPNAGGAEVVRYFGCWLDINQTQPQFPSQPSPADGPYPSGRKSIQDLIRNEHQCLVSEIAFSPAPAQSGSTPSDSDKLAQRNLAIVASANPGFVSSRRIPQTFEIRPSTSKQENDELLIDWGDVPAGSVATVYLPGIAASDVLLLAAKKYRSHRLVRIDEHTVRCDTGGITYLPIPFTDSSLPGMLTVDLAEGIEEGQVFKVVVRQVTSESQRVPLPLAEARKPSSRHIVGSFQLTIPVRAKGDILPGQQRLLSNLRWIERAIPSEDRWAPVFGRYVMQVAGRVDGLGGDSKKVAPSSSGQWREAYRTCLFFALATAALIAAVVAGSGTQSSSTVVLGGGIPAVALLTGTIRFWRERCRPTACQLLRALLAGLGIGALVLALMALLGQSTPRLVAALSASAGLAVATAVAGWMKRCFQRDMRL